MPTPHIINDCFVHRSIKSLFIKSPFAFSKIPSLRSLLRLRRWQQLAELPLWSHVCGISFFPFYFQLARDSEGSQRRSESVTNVRKAFERKRKDLREFISLNAWITGASLAWLFISERHTYYNTIIKRKRVLEGSAVWIYPPFALKNISFHQIFGWRRNVSNFLTSICARRIDAAPLSVTINVYISSTAYTYRQRLQMQKQKTCLFFLKR